jgi:cell wall-associated NlpC family hydrolase
VLLAVASVLSVIVAPAAGAAPADVLAAKREQARALERQIAENGRRISVLAEDYDESVLRVNELTVALHDAQARLDRARARAAHVRGLVRDRAAVLYRRAGMSAPLQEFDAANVREVGTRSKYAEAAAALDNTLLDQLGVARELLTEREDELDAQHTAALAEQERLDDARAEIEAAQSDHEALLDQVRGDIARLVREEQARREREAEAAARRQLLARLAARRAADDGAGRTFSPGLAPPNVPAPSPEAQIAVDTAKAQLGKPYEYAADGPDTFDCSGLTKFAWAAAGVSLPHSSRAQYASLPHVDIDQLAPGDLVFYGSPIHHVGIYVGRGRYVNAPQTGDVVKVQSIYRSDWAGAARPS